MDFEEIVDDDTGPGRRSVLLWVALVVVGLAVGSFLVSRGASPPPQTTAIVATEQAVKATPLPSVPEIIGLGHNLALGYTCPAYTIGGGTLGVSFQVTNFGEEGVTLLSVKPQLAKSGLRLASDPTMGGTCTEPASDQPGGLIAPGESRLITLRFTRPTGCTAAGKAQQLDVSVQQMVGATTKPVKSDLGQVYFTSCSAS